MEPYFNNSWGTGLEGIGNYVSSGLLEGLLPPIFISVIGVIMLYNLSKSEWKMTSNIAFTSFVCLLLAWIFKLFTAVNEIYIFVLVVILGASVAWSIIEQNLR